MSESLGSGFIKEGVPLSRYTSWLVGGEAEFYAAPTSADELKAALSWADKNRHSVTVLAGGTNVLISDIGISGLVIHLRKLNQLQVFDEAGQIKIVADCGVTKSSLLKNFLKRQLAPARFLAGLPGDVGGGIAMNAGVGESLVPREFVEITDWIEVMARKAPYEVFRMSAGELQWSYRSCRGFQPNIVVRAQFSWPMEVDENVLSEVKAANKARLAKQPLEFPSCGSVFKNPPGDKSGRLIESCGLKGFSIGGAQVSQKHANFIINTGEAKASDIDQLIRVVQQKVKEKTGVELTTEVVRLGLWPAEKS